MKRLLPIAIVFVIALSLGPTLLAQECDNCGNGQACRGHGGGRAAGGGHGCAHQTVMGAIASRQAQSTAWHGYYYDPAWGMPVALVVPPTVRSQTNWGWGVGNTRVTGVPHQYQPGYPMAGAYDRSLFRPTPPWPSDTNQFGVYYIRGPW